LLATDLADHDDDVGFVVLLERLENRLEIGAVHRVPADPDAGGLAQPAGGHLRHGLVVERAASRNDPDPSARVDVRRHDPDLALAGRDDPR
jgi:hypothetical protein